LAKALGIHRNTLRYYMSAYGVSRQFSTLSDIDLDALVRKFKRDKPDAGIMYIVGYLRSHGLRVQRR
ncbi:hypothetical protein BDQ17DRAFT_1178544, partial [Cyathus striatus]